MLALCCLWYVYWPAVYLSGLPLPAVCRVRLETSASDSGSDEHSSPAIVTGRVMWRPVCACTAFAAPQAESPAHI